MELEYTVDKRFGKIRMYFIKKDYSIAYTLLTGDSSMTEEKMKELEKFGVIFKEVK